MGKRKDSRADVPNGTGKEALAVFEKLDATVAQRFGEPLAQRTPEQEQAALEKLLNWAIRDGDEYAVMLRLIRDNAKLALLNQSQIDPSKTDAENVRSMLYYSARFQAYTEMADFLEPAHLRRRIEMGMAARQA